MALPCGSSSSLCWPWLWPWAFTSACVRCWALALGTGEIGWVCVLAAFPFALCGFFQYNGMTFEKFILALIRSELIYPKRLVFKSDNLYVKALESSTLKEALTLD